MKNIQCCWRYVPPILLFSNKVTWPSCTTTVFSYAFNLLLLLLFFFEEQVNNTGINFNNKGMCKGSKNSNGLPLVIAYTLSNYLILFCSYCILITVKFTVAVSDFYTCRCLSFHITEISVLRNHSYVWNRMLPHSSYYLLQYIVDKWSVCLK